MPAIISNPKTLISDDILVELDSFSAEQGQVVIHGLITSGIEPFFIRVWPTTYLFDRDSTHISELVYFEKITGFPAWTQVDAKKDFCFTLIFSGLPKTCKNFDLHEVIPQSHGFFIPLISRNAQDVYYLDFN